MQKICRSREWASVQRSWLERLAKQLKHESVIDRQYVNIRFADKGGAKQFDNILDQQLDPVLNHLNKWLWSS